MEDDTETKLAILSSLFPKLDTAHLFETLLSADGSVERATEALALLREDSGNGSGSVPNKRKASGPGHQASLRSWQSDERRPAKRLTRKGQTLHLYDPDDIAAHSPCSIIHDFLPAAEADGLLEELLLESATFERQTFKLFDSVVASPHSACFYVGDGRAREAQQTEYLYNGSRLSDVRQLTDRMRAVSGRVEAAVNAAIATRIRDFYPGGRKLMHQSPGAWTPNAAFVNCYAGGAESVGYHADQLTYLGPRPVIGSLSLGVAREFRVRKIVARHDDDETATKTRTAGATDTLSPSKGQPSRDAARRADEEGQIAITLPHNSLLVMHAEMQEEWKHSIAAAAAITPHRVAGSRRINVTYRHYRPDFSPQRTPRCRCGVPCVLRCATRRRASRGRYMWTCQVGNAPGKVGCAYFEWAVFDEDGRPPWAALRAGEGGAAGGMAAAQEGGVGRA